MISWDGHVVYNNRGTTQIAFETKGPLNAL